MQSDNDIAAGLLGGVVFGIMMQMMSAPTPEGGRWRWWRRWLIATV